MWQLRLPEAGGAGPAADSNPSVAVWASAMCRLLTYWACSLRQLGFSSKGVEVWLLACCAEQMHLQDLYAAFT